MAAYQFFQNRECEFFPCHGGAEEKDFNCLFCYCPLYALGEKCGGRYSYTPQGIKDCSGCLKPHIRGNYRLILSQIPQVAELAKKS